MNCSPLPPHSLSSSPFNVFHPECPRWPRPESHSIDSIPSRIPIAKNHEGNEGRARGRGKFIPEFLIDTAAAI